MTRRGRMRPSPGQTLDFAHRYDPAELNDNLSSAQKPPAELKLSLSSAQKPPAKVKPPPKQTHTAAAVAAISAVLLLGLPAAALADRIEAIMSEWRIDKAVIAEVLKIVHGGTAHRPNAVLKGARRTLSVTKVRDHDLHFRAAYIANAVFRVQRAVTGGESLPEAVARESRFFAMHEQARKGRLTAAAQVQAAADFFGSPEHEGTLVGWYLNPLLDNEAECIAANGHNFYAERGTVIGLPGSVHNGCGCYAGPPWTGAALVDDVFENLTALKPKVHAKFKLKERRA